MDKTDKRMRAKKGKNGIKWKVNASLSKEEGPVGLDRMNDREGK